MAYHFADDNKVHFINDENYPKKKEVVTKELFSTKDMEVKNSTVRMTSTSAGILACYVFEPPRTSEPGYKFQDEFADIKTYDIKTGQELQAFKKLNAGMMFGRSSHQKIISHITPCGNYVGTSISPGQGKLTPLHHLQDKLHFTNTSILKESATCHLGTIIKDHSRNKFLTFCVILLIKFHAQIICM